MEAQSSLGNKLRLTATFSSHSIADMAAHHSEVLVNKWSYFEKLLGLVAGSIFVAVSVGQVLTHKFVWLAAIPIGTVLVSLCWFENQVRVDAECRELTFSRQWLFWRRQNRIPLSKLHQVQTRLGPKGGREIWLSLVDGTAIYLCQSMGSPQEKNAYAEKIAARLRLPIVHS